MNNEITKYLILIIACAWLFSLYFTPKWLLIK